jgi:ABC-type sugar transport system ATPase subunit
MSAREDTADASDRRGRSTSERVVVSLRGTVLEPGLAPIDIDVHAGEIVGVAGLEGHGQERFLRVVAGVDQPVHGHVTLHEDGRVVPLRSQAEAARHRVVYVPRDRKTEGVFEPLSILDNFSLPTIRRDTVAGLVSDRSRRRRLGEYVGRLSIRYGSPRHRITTLSGGNQQKVIIARWLATGPKVLVLNDPTRGVDLGTKRDIYRQLDELASAGVAVVVLSTEVEEHMALMDRVLVFREGHVFAEIPADELTREGLVGAFFGRRAAVG